eukprot:gene53101-28869_t
MMMNYYRNGAYYPVGGSNSVASKLVASVERRGGRVLCRARVARIVVRDDPAAGPAGGRAAGVLLTNGDDAAPPL